MLQLASAQLVVLKPFRRFLKLFFALLPPTVYSPFPFIVTIFQCFIVKKNFIGGGFCFIVKSAENFVTRPELISKKKNVFRARKKGFYSSLKVLFNVHSSYRT